jgi:DNA-binding transcriptional LysR family regulator
MISSWDDLRHLEAFERLGSASAAGRELSVAPSTIYRRIASLEVSVGFTCLVRGKGVTPAGRELADLARSTTVSLSGIARRAKLKQEQAHGVVSLTTIDGFATLLKAPLSELAASHPQLRVEVHISDTGLSLRKNEAEIGLALLESPPSTLVGRRLFQVQFGVFGTAPLIAAAESARWITTGQPLQNSWLGEWEAQNVPRTRVAVATASRRLHVDLVAAGAGLGLLPTALAAEHPQLVEVASYRPRTAVLARQAWVLFPPELRRDARITAVVKVLARYLSLN